MISRAGLRKFSGSMNLILDVPASSVRSLVMASGSVDQTKNYVFEVDPTGVGESTSRSLSYWSTANGDDTMISVWNPADEDQDFAITFFFSTGHYIYPLHLPARATRTVNVSEIIHSQVSDADRNVIPISVGEGSALLSGSQSEAEHILVAWDVGTYNVRKATCGHFCTACQGLVAYGIAADPFGVGVSKTTQEVVTGQYRTGNPFDLTAGSGWTTSNSSMASVNKGLVSGIATGQFTLTASNSDSVTETVCSNFGPPICPPHIVQASAPGKVAPIVSLNVTNPFAFVGSDPSIPQTLMQAIGKPSNGTYTWTATPANRVTFNNPNTDVVQVKGINPSTSPSDTTLTVNYGVNGESAPASVAVTVRVFELLSQRAPVVITPQPNGFFASLVYNVLTGPGKQVLQPGFGGISVTENVTTTSATVNGVPLTPQQVSSITLYQGTGGTDANSEVGDDQRLLNNTGGPLPSGLVINLNQDLFVGGFFVRTNGIQKTSSPSVTITNNGPVIP